MLNSIVCFCILSFIAFGVFFAPAIIQQIGHHVIHHVFYNFSTFLFNDNEDNMNNLKAASLIFFVIIVIMLGVKFIISKVNSGLCHRTGCKKKTGLKSKVWCDLCYHKM